MTENTNQPRDYDAVLGGEHAAPVTGVVLGGLAGVKKRLTSPAVDHRVAAVKDALKYDKSGLEIVIQALQDKSDLVQHSAYLLLRERTETEVRQALKLFNQYRFFQCLRTIKGGTQIAISPDGETVATLGSNKIIKVWDIQTEELLYTVPKYPKAQQQFIISSDRKTLVRSIKSSSHFVEVWYEGELQHTLYGHEGEIRALAISPDRQTLASGSEDRTIRIWNLHTGKLILNINPLLTWGTHKYGIFRLAFSPDGKIIASSSADGTIKLWDWQNLYKPRTLDRFVSVLTISPDGQILGAISPGGQLIILHLKTGQAIHTLEGHPNYDNRLAFSPDGKTIASSDGSNRAIKFWNVQTGELLHTLSGHDSPVSCLVFSWDGQTLITGSYDKTIKIWGI